MQKREVFIGLFNDVFTNKLRNIFEVFWSFILLIVVNFSVLAMELL
jgi:hypothetical protein